MCTEIEATLIANYARDVLPLATASLGEEYFYQSLPLCVIDAVFSIGIRYSGVKRVVARYCKYTNQKRIRRKDQISPIEDQEAISVFCDRFKKVSPEEMADLFYQSRQRTSTRSGILKADAVYRFALCLHAYHVDYFQDLRRVLDDRHFEADIKRIPGQASGISLQYFWMLAGSDKLIKPDRMVLRFLEKALGRQVSVEEAVLCLKAACRQLIGDYPKLTPRLLDHEVWKFQREH